MSHLRLALVLIFVCLFPLSGYAQTPLSSSAPSEQERQKKEQELKEREEKALAMLEGLIETGRSLRLPENRSLVLSTAAGLLWRHDEKRARELFGEAIAIVTNLLRQPEESPDVVPDNFRWQMWESRRQLVEMLTRHDPQLASEFLLASRPPADKRDPSFNAENETNLEMAIAQQIAVKEPQRMLEIAEEMLAAGKPLYNLSGILNTLRDKNFESARKLAGLILAKLEAETPLNYNSAQFALYLAQFAPQPNETIENPATRRYLLTAAQARMLIEKTLAGAQAELAAAQQKNDQRRHQAIGLLNQLKSLTPYFEKHLPAGASALKRGLAEAEQLMEPGQRNWEALNKLAEKGSVDALLEAAAKAPAETRHSYFSRAAQMAHHQNSPERARQIITENITDKNQQRHALQELDRQALWRKISEQKFDEARQLMAKGRNSQERVNALVSMAQSAQNAGKKEMALDFLDEAWGLVDGPIESSQQLNAHLQLAGAYIRINSTRSFEIIEGSLEKFNELFGAVALLESFESHGSFRNKEMLLRGGGRGTNYLHQYTQPLVTLAVADPDRVQSVISRFARPDARASLQLIVVQQLLGQSRMAGQIPTLRRAARDK
ncbi:MAG: hypothetical protein ACREEM_03315 [Blastocatellia bacterium]